MATAKKVEETPTQPVDVADIPVRKETENIPGSAPEPVENEPAVPVAPVVTEENAVHTSDDVESVVPASDEEEVPVAVVTESNPDTFTPVIGKYVGRVSARRAARHARAEAQQAALKKHKK